MTGTTMAFGMLRAGFGNNFSYGEVIGYTILVYFIMCFARVI